MAQTIPGRPCTVSLNGRDYPLRFPLRQMKRLKDDHQIDLLKGGEHVADIMRDPERLAVLLSYGLRDPDSDELLTLDWILDNVDCHILMDIASKIIYAATGREVNLRVLINPPQAAVTDAADLSPTLVGSSSGPSDDTTSAYPNGSSGS